MGMPKAGTAVAVIGQMLPDTDSYSSAVVDCAAGATTAVIATPGASKQLWIYGLIGHADVAAGTIVLKDSAGTAYSGTIAVSDEGRVPLPHTGNLAMPWIKLATNTGFSITTAGCTFDGLVDYAVISL